MIIKITLRKSRSTWWYTAHNSEGGSFGSNHCGSKKVALGMAAVGVQPGEAFALYTNEKYEGQFTKDADGKVVKV